MGRMSLEKPLRRLSDPSDGHRRVWRTMFPRPDPSEAESQGLWHGGGLEKDETERFSEGEAVICSTEPHQHF